MLQHIGIAAMVYNICSNVSQFKIYIIHMTKGDGVQMREFYLSVTKIMMWKRDKNRVAFGAKLMCANTGYRV